MSVNKNILARNCYLHFAIRKLTVINIREFQDKIQNASNIDSGTISSEQNDIRVPHMSMVYIRYLIKE